MTTDLVIAAVGLSWGVGVWLACWIIGRRARRDHKKTLEDVADLLKPPPAP